MVRVLAIALPAASSSTTRRPIESRSADSGLDGLSIPRLAYCAFEGAVGSRGFIEAAFRTGACYVRTKQ